MDYTKDAILIHEGYHSLEKNEDIVNADISRRERLFADLDHNHSHEAGSIFSLAIANASEMIRLGRKVMTAVGTDLGSGNNGSLFLPASAISTTVSSALTPTTSSTSQDIMYQAGMGQDDNDTLEYIPMSMRPETYIVPVLFAIIFIIGVIGNGTLIVIFIKHRSMRNVPNMFIVSLAIGDLLVILFCVPFTSTVYTLDSWPYGLVVCKFSEFIKDLSVGVSVFTLTALSADRYFAIVDPMRKLTGRRATRVTIISIAGIWLLSILVALPSAIYSYVRVFPEYEEGEDDYDEEDDGRTFQVCYPYPTEFGPTYAQVMVMFHFLVYYAIPLFFIGTFYIIMARHLVLSTKNLPGEAQGQVKQIQARKKVAKMILSFVVIFAICFFPHHLFLLWFYFYPDSENSFNAFWNICRIVGFCLSFMNSCINPITLYCVSGTFRKQFNEHLFCCLCDKTGSRTFRGGRFSLGGTLAGGGQMVVNPGGNGGGGGGAGLCAACVSNGNINNGSRYGNGTLDRIRRESSDRLLTSTNNKRKSTWETQTTVVNHRVVNLNGILNGSASANIHINLCSEHEHIPLTTLKRMNYNHNLKPGISLRQSPSNPNFNLGEDVNDIMQRHKNHQHCYSAKTCLTKDDYYPHSRVRKPSWQEPYHLSPNYPSRIDEETSGSWSGSHGSGHSHGIEKELSSGNSHSHKDSHSHSGSSPTRSLSKVGDILKICTSHNSHKDKSKISKSSPKRKDTLLALEDGLSSDPSSSGADGEKSVNEETQSQPQQHLLQSGERVIEKSHNNRGHKNNNDYTSTSTTTGRNGADNNERNTLGLELVSRDPPESVEDEFTMTSFVSVPDASPKKLGKRNNVVICYN